MGAILNKDRKQSDLRALLKSEELAKSTLQMINNEKYISKRQRITFGNRLVDRALDSYECVRAANRIYPDSANDIRKRQSLTLQAEVNLNKLASDSHLLPCLNTTEEDKEVRTKKYANFQEQVVQCEKIVHNWRRSDNKRLNDSLRKLEEKSKNQTPQKPEVPVEFVERRDSLKTVGKK